jgi:PIN domain nuclease of toxin-antitoxin system
VSKAIVAPGVEVLVSAASAWEVATKFRIGKLPHAEPFVHAFSESVRKVGFHELAITVDHAQRAGLLQGEHKDPFDRLLIAQAQAENLVLVSNEKLFDRWRIHRLW